MNRLLFNSALSTDSTVTVIQQVQSRKVKSIEVFLSDQNADAENLASFCC